MSYVGNDIFDVFNISQSLDDASTHIKLSHNEISDLGMQIVSQLEVLHKIGYTHGDLKF
jgi:serine/threonine protein kinase|tara:strand:+ start:935 stop:1111 length:177 start_codon:yes stop_codon:yes gene_type:complete